MSLLRDASKMVMHTTTNMMAMYSIWLLVLVWGLRMFTAEQDFARIKIEID